MRKQTGYDPHPAYRPEIDGLRAIAVLAVVLYHFGVPGPDGGLVGVDIFFVISGFLIGGILWREQAATGRIRLGRFYLRRIRRLFPAYFAMALASFVVAYVVLLPFEFREFGKALIASTTYLANIHFFRETGYFDIGIFNKVLLHNWSLAVEEQFYVFLPFLILALRFSQWGLKLALVLVFAVSLGASIWLTATHQPAAFYLFPFRAWELLAGVLLAIWSEGRKAPAQPWLSWLGMALMLGGIIWVRPGADFPGWQVIVPVAGAVLSIAGGRAPSLVNRLLSTPIPVFFGRISYSLYLWHWPVLTLSLYWRGGYASVAEAAGWLTLALVLSVLSWRFVEQPVRQAGRVSGRALVLGWLVGSVLLLGLGAWAYKTNGAAGRFAPEIRSHIDASADFLQDWSRCAVATSGPLAGLETCAIGPEGAPQVLIWGDSHIRSMKAGLEQAAYEAATPAMLVWVAGCPPLFGVEKQENTTSPEEDAACRNALSVLDQAVAQGGLPPVLLLVGRWSYYAEGQGVGLDAGNRITLRADGREGGDVYADAMAKTLTRFAGAFRRVFVLRQPPEVPGYDSREVARDMAGGRLTASGALTRGSVDVRAAAVRADRAMAPLLASEARGEITLLDTWPYFCGMADCSAMPDGQALYFDNNHLTNAGGRRLAPLFAQVFAAARP